MTQSLLQPKNRYLWCVLAFQGGFVNVGGFLCVHIFVSHVTGLAAHFGMEFISKNYMDSFYFLIVPIFFLMGSFFSASFAEWKKKKNSLFAYEFILFVLALTFLWVGVLGYNGFFGSFGEEFQSFRDFILLSLLAFACGTQNAIVTHYSKSIIRTTHLTGITTDLGIGLAKKWIGKDLSEDHFNRIRVELILSFILGCVFGSYLFPKMQFIAFFIPACISLFVLSRLMILK